MNKAYEDRLKAIHEMLTISSREVVREGYDLLFSLWLENLDVPDFQQDLVLLAVEEVNLVKELEHRLNDMIIREKITDIYLRFRLKKLAEDVEEFRLRLQKEKDDPMKPKKLFISYSHKDEAFKDELVTMLAGLQRQGIIDPWQDRRIEAGAEWLDDICRAMEECNMAVLLISPDFIASPFVQDNELTRLLQQRIEEGLRVVPIIIRPCLWQQEPTIRDLQVVPRDGKPVISFSKENGDRDQVWAEIGGILRNLAIQR